MSTFSLEAKIKNLKEFQELEETIRKEVIENGLDEQLIDSIKDLRIRLFSIINNDIKAEEQVEEGNKTEHSVNMPKADKEIIKHFTGLDIENFNLGKGHTKFYESKIVYHVDRRRDFHQIDSTQEEGQGRRAHPMSSGVNYRIPMEIAQDFDTQYGLALTFFNEATFAFKNERGKVEYYINPGLDLTRFVKVVCSTKTGDDDESRDVLDKNIKEKEFADWTLLANGVKYVKDNFINLNDVIRKVKTAEYDDAKTILGAKAKNTNDFNKLNEKVNNLENNEELAPSTQAYNKITQLIRNLRIKKTIKRTQVIYKLVSTVPFAEETLEFEQEIRSAISLWKITNASIWVKSLVKKAEEVIDKLD